MYEDVELDCTALGFDSTCWDQRLHISRNRYRDWKLLFQWRASDHVPLADSYKDRGNDGRTKETSYDFFHLNSIEKDESGNYLISSRHVHTLYYLDRTGEFCGQWVADIATSRISLEAERQTSNGSTMRDGTRTTR